MKKLYLILLCAIPFIISGCVAEGYVATPVYYPSSTVIVEPIPYIYVAPRPYYYVPPRGYYYHYQGPPRGPYNHR